MNILIFESSNFCNLYSKEETMEEQKQPLKLSQEEKYNIAKKRVNEIRGYYGHLAIYIIVNITLVLIWYFTDRGSYMWFFWPLGAWGVGIILQTLSIFVFRRGNWEQRKINEIMDKIE
jgi:hypothetical protein